MSRAADARLRLLSAKERNDMAGERQAGMRARFDRIANRGDPVVVAADNLFPTPPDIAARMVRLADLRPGHRVLEPSAGTGHILDALPRDVETVAVELVPELCKHLFQRYPHVSLKTGDFLARSDLGLFDRVVMNPPFRRSSDVRHIQHALSMLKPGGLLVSLCYAGSAQHRHLQPIATTWEALPARSFASEGTGAGVVLLTIRK